MVSHMQVRSTHQEVFVMSYEKLFSRGRIGNLNLKSRIVLPAMGTGLVGPDCIINDAAVSYL